MHTTFDDVSLSDFQRLSRIVYNYCGINLQEGKQQLVKSRLGARVRKTGDDSISAYLDRVLADTRSPEFVHLVDSLSTNLTSFFRENKHFEFLQSTVIPRLIASGRRQLRCWSAGCSSGEEAYTIAITLLETLRAAGEDPAHWDAKVLATDISTRVLSRATAGVYDHERVKTVPPAVRARYFDPRQQNGVTAYAVRPEVRRMITFRRLNLMEPFPFTGPLDFIFCRNVMIYFDKQTQQKLVGRYHDVLAPGAVLFTGHSESLTGVEHKFQYVQASIYRK